MDPRSWGVLIFFLLVLTAAPKVFPFSASLGYDLDKIVPSRSGDVPE